MQFRRPGPQYHDRSSDYNRTVFDAKTCESQVSKVIVWRGYGYVCSKNSAYLQVDVRYNVQIICDECKELWMFACNPYKTSPLILLLIIITVVILYTQIFFASVIYYSLTR